MRLTVEANGRARSVDVSGRDGIYRIVIDGVEREVDAAAVDDTTFSLICLGSGRASREVGLGPSPVPGETAVHMPAGVAVVRVLSGPPGRSGRGGGGAGLAQGTQQVVTPMPGRVVKVLVRVGDEVRARQGIVVVEAMKMENELRSPKDGRVTRILVDEGAPVEAGRPLVVID
ncbi:MAG TPA: hypothetical protein PLN93_04330 [Vicinamibacterales bacterium]|nr:hypothetical protein [Vicinamibacterales bacterium]HOQ60656.1 hypothetical protein [Vicinamibacterales bacterium]HPK71149.1 hypothetical protein [Vicinamibacterales bacterium]HPW19902.1 hypothetical protein [Vicinamibacterales bacterium]